MSPPVEWKTVHAFPDASMEARWRECVADADFRAHYVMPEYFREPFWVGRHPFAVLAVRGEEVLGVLTGLHQGSQLISGMPVRPQVCCRASADRDAVTDALVGGVLAEAGAAGLITLHTWNPMDGFERRGFRRRVYGGAEGTIILDLSKGPERLFAECSESRCNNIRKSIKLGVEVALLQTPQDLPEYHRIYTSWCRLKGHRASPIEIMVATSRQPNQRLFLAKHEGRIVAGSEFRLCPGGIIEYAANFSRPESQTLKPNDLLMWRAIEWACREGFALLSLGGAHAFLQRFGGEPHTTYRYRLDRTWLRRHDLTEAILRRRTKVFQVLPQPVRKVIRALARRAMRLRAMSRRP